MTDDQPLIYIIDDEMAIGTAWQGILLRKGFRVKLWTSAERALECVLSDRPSVVVLDLRLPGMNGFEALARFREFPETRSTPVILVSGVYKQEADIMQGLQLGADYYLLKPLSGAVLLEHIRAALRRGDMPPVHCLPLVASGDVEVDPARMECRIREQKIHLPPAQLYILYVLIRHEGRFLRCSEIASLARIGRWGLPDTAVQWHIHHLRRRLGPLGNHIQDKKACGYCWEAPALPSSTETPSSGRSRRPTKPPSRNQ